MKLKFWNTAIDVLVLLDHCNIWLDQHISRAYAHAWEKREAAK